MRLCAGPTPPLYPNVVTMDPRADPSRQREAIVALAEQGLDPDFSVKDSFARLDLEGAGFSPLFDAVWLAMSPTARPASLNNMIWRTIDNERDLSDWEAAWAGSPPGTRIFRPALLADPSVRFLAGHDDAGRIMAGGALCDSAGVLGLTNVFGRWAGLLGALGKADAERDIVCYAPGDDHRHAEALGFVRLGPLRVWRRTI